MSVLSLWNGKRPCSEVTLKGPFQGWSRHSVIPVLSRGLTSSTVGRGPVFPVDVMEVSVTCCSSGQGWKVLILGDQLWQLSHQRTDGLSKYRESWELENKINTKWLTVILSPFTEFPLITRNIENERHERGILIWYLHQTFQGNPSTDRGSVRYK